MDNQKAVNAVKTVPFWTVLVVAIVALAIGWAIGRFFFGSAGSANGKITLKENELDTTIGTLTYKNKTEKITAREAIEAATSLKAAKNKDGVYTVPGADKVLAVARNKILAQACDEAKINVTDEDIQQYAEKALKTKDLKQIASKYSMTEEQVKKLIGQSARVKKLYNSVVKTADVQAPAAPNKPKDGNNDAATEEYGKYIIGLLGDEWDANKGTWAKTDGKYYKALKDQKFTATSASYAQAQAAYYVAYQEYSSKMGDANAKWSKFVNERLSQASIQISTLVS